MHSFNKYKAGCPAVRSHDRVRLAKGQLEDGILPMMNHGYGQSACLKHAAASHAGDAVRHHAVEGSDAGSGRLPPRPGAALHAGGHAGAHHRGDHGSELGGYRSGELSPTKFSGGEASGARAKALIHLFIEFPGCLKGNAVLPVTVESGAVGLAALPSPSCP